MWFVRLRWPERITSHHSFSQNHIYLKKRERQKRCIPAIIPFNFVGIPVRDIGNLLKRCIFIKNRKLQEEGKKPRALNSFLCFSQSFASSIKIDQSQIFVFNQILKRDKWNLLKGGNGPVGM